MQFESKQKRDFIINGIIGLIPDLVVSAAISHFTNSGVSGFIAAVTAIQCAYFAIWIKNLICMLLLFKYNYNKTVRNMDSFMRSSQFPSPNEYEKSPALYFSSIIENEELDPAVRIKAAALYGGMQALSGSYKYFENSMQNVAYEEAIENYKMYLEREQQPT